IAALVALSAAVTVAYSGRMVVTTLPGPATTLASAAGTGPMVAAIATGAIAAAVLGMAAPVLDGVVGRAVDSIAGGDAVHLSLWHGFTPALGLSVAAILVGLGLVTARRLVDRLLARPLF